MSIHIIGMGARTPVGLRAAASAAAVRAGIRRTRLVRDPEDEDGEGELLAPDALLGPLDDSCTKDRVLPIARSALEEVLQSIPSTENRGAIPVFLGLPEERPGWRSRDVAEVAGALQPPGYRLDIEACPLGHAAALEGLRRARERLLAGECSTIVVGGADSYLDRETLEWLDENRQRKTEETRSGFVPGEAAGFVALMRSDTAAQARVKPLARVASAASASESKRIKTDDDNLGEGLTAAVTAALAGTRGRVDEIYCDINGERYRSEEWGFVALRIATSFRDVSDYRIAASSWGDVGAASGALNAITCIHGWRRTRVVGARALIWGSSEHGLRSAAVLEAS